MMDEATRDELLIRLDERTGTILTRLEKGDKVMENHDGRINLLESCEDQRKGTVRFAAIVAGVISTCGVVVSILVSVLRGGS
jgi:hypothetical protein